MLVRCQSIRQSVRLCTDCLSANQIKEFVAYFNQYTIKSVIGVVTHWEKLLDSDWLRHCEFIRNLRANSVIRGKLQISRAKSVIHSECKYKQELRINN